MAGARIAEPGTRLAGNGGATQAAGRARIGRIWRCGTRVAGTGRYDVDVVIGLLVIVLFGMMLWIVEAVGRLGGGRSS
jgi:hypothetical protein